jgi:hypothetical protein
MSEKKGEKTAAAKKRKGLPATGETWEPAKHDMVVMGRLSRDIEGVPPAAMRRIAPWFSSLLAEAMREPPFEGAKAGLSTQGVQQWPGWNAEARAFKQEG